MSPAGAMRRQRGQVQVYDAARTDPAGWTGWTLGTSAPFLGP